MYFCVTVFPWFFHCNCRHGNVCESMGVEALVCHELAMLANAGMNNSEL